MLCEYIKGNDMSSGRTGASERRDSRNLEADYQRQFREILDFCPAALSVVDEDGRLLFHNARLRELLGYDYEEMEPMDTRKLMTDLGSWRPCERAAGSF